MAAAQFFATVPEIAWAASLGAQLIVKGGEAAVARSAVGLVPAIAAH